MERRRGIKTFGPQPGPQTKFLGTEADIAIYGGQAGGGKTFALLLEPLRHYHNTDFGGIIFRRTTRQIRNEGGLWDTSKNIYSYIGARPRETTLDWVFPSGMKVQFAHLEYDKNVLDWQGAQMAFIGFDELTHFSFYQFFYLISRLRSTSGVPGYIRATTNPSKKSWVRKFIDWWIDPVSGLPIPERDGVLRWFIREGDKFIWADSKEELVEKFGVEAEPISVTFIKSTVHDNKILLEKDPRYLANLKALSRVERMQLLDGNWNVEPAAGDYFKKHYFTVIDAVPLHDITRTVRCWDKAATEMEPGDASKDPDWTVGIKMAKGRSGNFYVLGMVRERLGPFKVEQLTLSTAKSDGVGTEIKIYEDPGSAGKYESQRYTKVLAGFSVKVERVMKDKQTMAKPVSAQSEAGNIFILRGPWNEDFFSELESFPDGGHDDIVDALSGAFNMLTLDNVGDFTKEYTEPQKHNNFQTDKIEW